MVNNCSIKMDRKKEPVPCNSAWNEHIAPIEKKERKSDEEIADTLLR